MVLRPASKEALQPFLSRNTHRVLAEGLEFRLDRLRSLKIEIAEVEKLASHPNALSFVVEQGLYRISTDNIRFIVDYISGGKASKALEKRHLSTLNEMNDAVLLRRIDSDFPTYVSDVLLALPTNTSEDISAISQVLGRDDVEHDLRLQFLDMQTAVFPNFNGIPDAFQQVALAGHRVEPTWENCLQFMNSVSYDAGVLTAYLQTDQAVAALSQQAIPSGEPALVLQQFVHSNDAIGTDIYRSYIRKLPVRFRDFPDVDDGKKKVLIEERKVALKPASFQSLENHELRVQFISQNFDTYAAGKSEYPMDDEFQGKLLFTSITDTQKLNVLADMDESYVASTPSVAAIVGPLLDRSPDAGLQYGVDFIKAIVLHSQNVGVQISLLNKVHPTLSVHQVRDILHGLPMPFQDIAAFGKAPKLENNEQNRQLAKWLKERDVISSFSETLFGGEIRINTFRKEPG